MAYTAQQLITKSWYLSGIVSRNLQTVTGDQLQDGLELLNAMLAVKTANVRLIPYFQEYNFTAVVGQEMYFVPNLVSIETLTFYIGPVRYSMLPTKRISYWGSGRIDQINSLPFSYNFERVLDGANVFIYFTPAQAYPMVLWGKFSIPPVTLNEDLETVLDDYYIEYLRYALAGQMCEEYNLPMQPQAAQRLYEIEKMIMDVGPPDLSQQKMSSLQENVSINYADVNIGRGWRP